MKYILMLIACLMAGCATLPAPAPAPAVHAVVAPSEAVETLANDTAGVLLVTLSGKPMGFVFVSKTGKILPESTEACQRNEACVKLVQRLIDTGHVTTLQLGEEKPLGTQT